MDDLLVESNELLLLFMIGPQVFVIVVGPFRQGCAWRISTGSGGGGGNNVHDTEYKCTTPGLSYWHIQSIPDDLPQSGQPDAKNKNGEALVSKFLQRQARAGRWSRFSLSQH